MQQNDVKLVYVGREQEIEILQSLMSLGCKVELQDEHKAMWKYSIIHQFVRE